MKQTKPKVKTKQKARSKEKPDTLRQKVARYRSLFENMINGFAFHKVLFDDSERPCDYVFLEVNDAFERLTGLRREDVIGKKVTVVLPGIENDPADWIGTYGRVALTGQVIQFENYSVPLKKWYSVSAYSPEKGYFASILEDFTDHKRTEEALRESERRLARSQEIAHLGSWELDLVNNHLSWSDEVYRIFGLQTQEFGATYEAFLDAVHPDDRVAVDAAYSGSLREGRDTYEIEHRIVRKSTGEVRFVHEKCEHIRDESGWIIRSIGMVQDITERKRLEEELNKYTEHLETLVKERTGELSKAYREFEAFFNYSITPLVFLDREFNFIRVNEAYAIACNRAKSDFIGRNYFELYPHEENEAIFRRVVETKVPYQAVAKPFSFPDHPERRVTYWDWTLTPILDKHGEVDFLVFSLKDVTERKKAGDALRISEEKYRSLIEQAADGIAILDKWLNIVDVNPAICQISGFSREDLLGVNIKNLIPSEDLIARPLQIEKLFAGETIYEERKLFRKDGILIDVGATVRLLEDGNIQVIARDITERKERESRNMLITGLLALFAKKESRQEYLDAVVQLIYEWSDCQCVGIRVVNEHGYIPYESYAGFSLEFYRLENMLSLDKDMCACVRTVTGQFEHHDKSVLTPNGSFCINNSLEFAAGLKQEELAMFRGYCIQSGFLSIALVPVRYPGRTIGLIHLADEREGMFPFKVIEFLETITPLIGEAIFRFNTEDELRNSREQLRDLFAHLQSVREQERAQIAREIHDEFGAVLTGLKVDLTSLEKRMPAEREMVRERLRADLELVDSAIHIVRRISSELRPSVLDHLGLTAAIEWQVKEFGNRSGIPWDISIDIKDACTDRDLSTTVFRIFQEALMNVLRHAEATKINVNVKESDGFLILDVIDNGKGIPEEKLSDPHSFGLLGMRERVKYLGGDLEIKGIMDKGTTVTVKIPVKGKEAV